MKIATIIVRILLGGMMLFASIGYFLDLGEKPVFEGDMLAMMTGFTAMKYLFPLAKVIELICGLAILSGKFLRLALIVLLPISVNIFLIHVVVSKAEIPVAAGILVANVFLIYANWNSYKHLFTP